MSTRLEYRTHLVVGRARPALACACLDMSEVDTSKEERKNDQSSSAQGWPAAQIKMNECSRDLIVSSEKSIGMKGDWPANMVNLSHHPQHAQTGHWDHETSQGSKQGYSTSPYPWGLGGQGTIHYTAVPWHIRNLHCCRFGSVFSYLWGIFGWAVD